MQKITRDNVPQIVVNAPVQLTDTESLFVMRLIENTQQYAIFNCQQFCEEAQLDEAGFDQLCAHLEDLRVIERTDEGSVRITAAMRKQLIQTYKRAVRPQRTGRGTGGRPAAPRVSFTLRELPEPELSQAQSYVRRILRASEDHGVYAMTVKMMEKHRGTAEFARFIVLQDHQGEAQAVAGNAAS